MVHAVIIERAVSPFEIKLPGNVPDIVPCIVHTMVHVPCPAPCPPEKFDMSNWTDIVHAVHTMVLSDGQTQILSDGQYLGLSVGLSGVHVRGLAPPCEQHITEAQLSFVSARHARQRNTGSDHRHIQQQFI
jgi:hypothetical protein